MTTLESTLESLGECAIALASLAAPVRHARVVPVLSHGRRRTASSRTVPRTALALLALLAALAGCRGGERGSYVGTWRPAEPDTLGMQYSLFADGTARIIARPPLGEPQAFDARYEIDGDSALTLSDAQGAERFRVRLDGDTLRLWSPASGGQTAWVRVEG